MVVGCHHPLNGMILPPAGEVMASASPGLSRLPPQLRGEAVLGWLAALAAMLPCGVTWREKVVPSRTLIYPIPRHFWRWWSFSQDGIGYIVLEQIDFLQDTWQFCDRDRTLGWWKRDPKSQVVGDLQLWCLTARNNPWKVTFRPQ